MFRKGEHMNQNENMDSFFRDKGKKDGADDTALEDPLSFWHDEKKSALGKISGASAKPYLFIGAGVVALVLLVMILFPGGGSRELEEKLTLLSGRLDQMEQKLTAMEAAGKGTAESQSQLDRLDKSILRMDGVDAALISRLDSMAGELASLRREASAVKVAKPAEKPAPAPAAPVPAPKAAAPKPSKVEPVYHTVAAGETLFSISRRYSVSVDAIRSLNGLTDKSSIQTGQKLKVKSSGD